MSTGESHTLPHKKIVRVADMEFTVRFGTVNSAPIAVAVYGLPEVTVTHVTGLSLEHAVYNAERFLHIMYFRADELCPAEPTSSP